MRQPTTRKFACFWVFGLKVLIMRSTRGLFMVRVWRLDTFNTRTQMMDVTTNSIARVRELQVYLTGLEGQWPKRSWQPKEA